MKEKSISITSLFSGYMVLFWVIPLGSTLTGASLILDAIQKCCFIGGLRSYYMTEINT